MSIFGYNTAGATADYTLGNNVCILGKFTLSEAASVSKLTASISTSSSMNIKGLIYDDDGATGFPMTLLGVTDVVALGTVGKDWVDMTFASPIALSAGNYWLGFVPDTNGGVFYSTASGGVSGYEGCNYTNPANPLNQWTSPGTYQMSVYATYVGVAAPTVTTTAITAITQTTATGGGTITDPGSATVTAKGVVWSTSPNPTLASHPGGNYTSD